MKLTGTLSGMWILAADTNAGNVSIPTFVIVLIIGGVIYLFGYLRAVMHRANRDYKAIKAAKKPAQKAFWAAWYAVLKIGFWVFVVFGLLFFWVWHDLNGGDSNQRPVPAASTSVKPSPSRR